MSLKRHNSPVEVNFRSHGYAILESHHEEDFRMDWRRDPFPKILLFIGGEGVMETGGQGFAIRSPMVCVVPKGRKHRIMDAPSKPLSLYGICIQSPQFPSGNLLRSVCGEFRVVNESRRIRRIESWLRELLAEERLQQADFEDAQVCLITAIILELSRTPRNDAVQITDSAHRVKNYAEALENEFWKNEDIDTVAQTLGLSRRRFTQLFREIVGESWQKRVTGLRMKYAADLLQRTSLSIRSIAFECGYRDLSHFYRVFKQMHGMSPGQYRAD
jgi:AraC-like DNA-binding protein/mannose-6-phosphate isomerase-like protein (cupin superfamily)